MAKLDLAKFDNELGCQWELAVIGNDKTHAVLKNKMHLALRGMGYLDLDKHRVVERPGLGGFGFWHPQKMRDISDPHQISPEAAFQTLTLYRLPGLEEILEELDQDQ